MLSPKSDPQISIVIPSHLDGTNVLALLSSIELQKNPPAYEVIVIANPPNFTLEKEIAVMPKVRYLSTQKVGANEARNTGIKTSKGEILLFLDADCLIKDPFLLRNHWELHNSELGVTGIGGLYTNQNTKNLVTNAYHILQRKWIEFGPHPGYSSDVLLGGNMSVKKGKLGNFYFDQTLQYGGTETEFIFRMVSLGYSFKCFPQLIVEHGAALSLGNFLRKAFRQGQGSSYLKAKNYWNVSPVILKGTTTASASNVFLSFILGLYDVFFQLGFFWGHREAPKMPSIIHAVKLIFANGGPKFFFRITKLRFVCALLASVIYTRNISKSESF